MIMRSHLTPTVRRLISAVAMSLCLMAFGTAPAVAAQFIQGTTGQGALYEFAVPYDWNGVLVVYAHGIINPFLPVALPTTTDKFDQVRDALLENRIAVAYSSFSENGFALKDGIQRTHQLRGLFKSKVGVPSHVYIAGHSLGGMVAVELTEKHPGHYDGTLAMCGFMGGTEPQVEYLTNVRILFDALFPGVLPGNAFDVPLSVAINPLPSLGLAQQALVEGLGSGKTQKLFEHARIPGADLGEKITSVIHALGYNLIFINDLLARTHGHIPFDNMETDYGCDAINAAVDRFSASPDAVNYIQKYVTPSGNLTSPMITMHTTRDSLVPVAHQDLYLGKVAGAGASELLRQRIINSFGHCNFTVAEMMQAFYDLRSWVEEGTVPAP
jgi:pimeloyl-ACP methyl ester carboxylesterase